MQLRHRILSFLFFTAFLGMMDTGHTADKWALLVGIDNYQNDIGDLKYCVADVEAFRKELIETAGFKPDKVFLMTDRMSEQDQPSQINVILRLDILAGQVQPEDTFIFYFSGHGISTDDQSFLLATDSNATTTTTLELSAIPLQKVRQILSKIKAQQLLTIIDACRNNPASGRGSQDNLLSDDFARGFKVQRQAGSSGKPAVSATLYACSVGERAYEWSEKKHGVFSYYLLEGLKGEAANANGDVTIADLADYTQRKVVDWAQTYRGKKQTPWLSLQGGSKLILAKNVVKETVKVESPTETVNIESVETKATLFINSIPQGATIYINQQKMEAKTPAVFRIGTGISRQKQVEVGLELEGYEALVVKSTLVGGQLVELKNLQLVKVVPLKSHGLVTGSIWVNSEPSGAQVFLDGIRQSGETPTTLKELVIGPHSIKLTFSNYQDYQGQIEVESGQITDLVVDLVSSKSTRVKRTKWPWIGGGLAIVGTGIAVYLFGGDGDNSRDVEELIPPLQKKTTLDISIIIP